MWLHLPCCQLLFILSKLSPALVLAAHLLQDPLSSGLVQSATLQYKPAFAACGVDLLLLPNSRTPGASGAWNSGLLAIMSEQMSKARQTSIAQPSPGDSTTYVDPCAKVFVAILGERHVWPEQGSAQLGNSNSVAVA
jgi:hypothetical protein